MTTATTTKDDDLIAVPVTLLLASKVVGVSLYIRHDRDEPCKLFRGPDYPLQQADLEKLHAEGIHHLYVESHDNERYQRYLQDNLTGVLDDETLPPHTRFGGLNEVVRSVLSEVFSQKDVDQAMEQTKQLGQHTVDFLCREELPASHLLKILRHDYHTFTHVANVTFYTVILAQRLGITEEAALHEIAIGALLHDFGKIEVPHSILTKKGRLTNEEFEVVKQHPTTGFRLLSGREDLTFAQLMMVYQHHERLNGSGYPVGAVGDEIHAWACLCAVADVFEALTSDRPYRRRMSLTEALKIMERQKGSGFDEEVLECLMTFTACN